MRMGIIWYSGSLMAACLAVLPAPACCPAPPYRKGSAQDIVPVVNADQTVLLFWDATNKTQHFIRQASFLSEADDFGFLIPSPSEPELEETGDEAFLQLYELTKPRIERQSIPMEGLSCRNSKMEMKSELSVPVRVLQEKTVAGFRAAVLEAKSAVALVGWLKENGYPFSPMVAAWAKPYVEGGWMITALKVAKGLDEARNSRVTAGALRMSFRTEQPIFPYREPDQASSATALGAESRLLRIYFLAEGRYRGRFRNGEEWKANVPFAGWISDSDRVKISTTLNLPAGAGPAKWWLTEFEHDWPYKQAPGDVYFSLDPNQGSVQRPPIIQYYLWLWQIDIFLLLLLFLFFLWGTKKIVGKWVGTPPQA